MFKNCIHTYMIHLTSPDPDDKNRNQIRIRYKNSDLRRGRANYCPVHKLKTNPPKKLGGKYISSQTHWTRVYLHNIRFRKETQESTKVLVVSDTEVADGAIWTKTFFFKNWRSGRQLSMTRMTWGSNPMTPIR